MNEYYSIGKETFQFNSTNVHQLYDDTCAIKSQQLILQSHGIDKSEDELREEAIQNGWYSPGNGTPMGDVGNLLEHHGMIIHRYKNATLSDLADELSQGHQIIVGVDSGELWNAGISEHLEDLIMGGQADHALLVSGFVVDPMTAESNILLTDPGTGEIYADYPILQFENAWNDSDNFMVVAAS